MEQLSSAMTLYSQSAPRWILLYRLNILSSEDDEQMDIAQAGGGAGGNGSPSMTSLS